jgi:TPR repeat protein
MRSKKAITFSRHSTRWQRFATSHFAAAHGYPIAFNNLANAYQDGVGVHKDSNQAFKYYLQAFNRVVACCAVRVAQHILEIEHQYDASTVRKIARELLDQAAALGVPQAHEALADFYEVGRFTLAEPGAALADAYVHYKLATKLFGANGASEDALRLEKRADEIRAKLTPDQVQAAAVRITSWRKAAFDSSPWSWLGRD